MGISIPSSARARVISRVASSECPPSVEEAVVDSDLLQAEHLGEQRASDLLAGVRGAR